MEQRYPEQRTTLPIQQADPSRLSSHCASTQATRKRTHYISSQSSLPPRAQPQLGPISTSQIGKDNITLFVPVLDRARQARLDDISKVAELQLPTHTQEQRAVTNIK